MGKRTPQNRAVQHSGQLQVIDVMALTAYESGVFLAKHAAEANRAARPFFGCGCRRHRVLTCAVAGCSAAHRTAFTMFR